MSRSSQMLGNQHARKHGWVGTPEYAAWVAMISRCEGNHEGNKRVYQERGIGVAPEWRQDVDAFIKAVGPRPTHGHSLDRIDNEKGYEPGNVRWATRSEQARNRRDNVKLTFGGRTMCLLEWAAELGITPEGLAWRVKRWPLEKALTATKGPTGPRKKS